MLPFVEVQTGFLSTMLMASKNVSEHGLLSFDIVGCVCGFDEMAAQVFPRGVFLRTS